MLAASYGVSAVAGQASPAPAVAGAVSSDGTGVFNRIGISDQVLSLYAHVIYICMYAYIYVAYMYICMYVYLPGAIINISVCMYVCMHACFLRILIPIFVHIYTSFMCVMMCICVVMYVYI